jgi:hypothetical protein
VKTGLILGIALLATTACGDDGDPTGAGAGPSTGSPSSSSASTGASVSTTGASTTGASTTAGGTTTGSGGSCPTPVDITLPYQEQVGDTASAQDITDLSCNADSLPEAAYRLVLASEQTVTWRANDSSGQGVGVEVFMDDCNGTSLWCDWAANGIVDRTLVLPAGTWFFVLERKPAGPYDFSIEID